MSEKTVVKIPEAVVQGIRSAGNVVLLTHVHPDGDALGSTLAFAEILEGLGKNTYLFMEEEVSHLYQYLPGIERVQTDFSALLKFYEKSGEDCVILALDAGDRSRLGKYTEELLRLRPFVVVDHHISHQNYGQHRWVDPTTSSTGEMVYELACCLEATVPYNAAFNLYVAICSDTGSFKYESTGVRTLQIASELVELGVRPSEVAGWLYENLSIERMRLFQLVLGTMQLHLDDQLATIHVNPDMIAASGATIQDVEGFIDYPRSLSSVEVVVFFKETGENQIAISLRAKGQCNVAEIASEFAGGGHRNAAGFRLYNTTIEEVQESLLKKIHNRLELDAL